jgi:hypothetical protein
MGFTLFVRTVCKTNAGFIGMLGFLKKVTSSSRGGETPIVPSTPGTDSFSHTPIIKNSTKKKATEDNIFSMYKK